MAVTYLAVGPVMASFAPYVSEFEFTSEFHPSNNPDCINKLSSDSDEGNDEFTGSNSEYRRPRRYPEEGSPIGQESSIEVRAILVRCPINEEETDDILINRNIYNITDVRIQDILEFRGFERDEPENHLDVRGCRRKLIITMKLNNIGRTKTEAEFVVIDHVMDAVTMQKSRLLNPFIVVVRQEPVLQLYGLKLQGVVNAQAREEVINKNLSNYTGCDEGWENPTCGQMVFEEKPVPYSQGFCCSCTTETNTRRQASLLNESSIPPFLTVFYKNKFSSLKPSKSSRSLNQNESESKSNLGNFFQDQDPDKNSENPHFDHNSVFPKDQNQDHEKAASITLKNLSTMPRENQETLDSSLYTSDHVDLTVDVMKLEKDYKNLRRSIRGEGGNNEKGVRKWEKNDNEADMSYTERIQNKMTTKIGNDLQEYLLTFPYGKKMTFPGKGQSNDCVPPLSIDVLFAIKPKQKSTTCPVHETMKSPATCSLSRCQKGINDKILPSRVGNSSYTIVKRQETVHFDSLEVTSDSRREIGINSSTNVTIPEDAEIPRTNYGQTSKSRPRKTNIATCSSTTPFPDTERESKVTLKRTTGNFQHIFHPTQSFDNHSIQVESSTKLSASFSSGNYAKDEAISLSGSFQNQLANWLLYDKEKILGGRRGRTKSKKNVGEQSGIGYGNEVGSLAMKIPNRTPDDLRNGHHYGVQMTTTSNFRSLIQTYLKTDRRFDRYDKDNTFSNSSDPEEVNVAIPKKSEPLIVPRSHTSIDYDSVWDEDTDQQKSIDKESENEFVDISEALKDAANDPTSEKDNSVIGKFDLIVNNIYERKSIMETNSPIQDNPFDDPAALKKEIDIKVMNSTGVFDGPEVPEPIRPDMLSEKLIPKEIGSPKLRRHNVVNDSNQADDSEILKLSLSFSDVAISESGFLEVKHPEVSREPFSEFPLTTGPQITKIVRPFLDSPKNYEQLLKSTIKTHPRNVDSEIRDLEDHDEPTPETILLLTLFDKENRKTESIFENISTVPPKIGTQKTPVIFDSSSSVKNVTSLHSKLSPVLMIENLKKELRKEAERYADSSSPLQSTAVNSTDHQGYPDSVQAIREVNIEMTPAENVEDLVTDEKTLPPDEETVLAAQFLSKTMTMTNTVSSSMINDLENVNYTLIPRRFLQDPKMNSPNKKRVVPLKRFEKQIMLPKKLSQSPSSSSLWPKSEMTHKKQNRIRRHYRHHKRLSSTKYPKRVQPASKSGKVSVCLSQKPENYYHVKLDGFRVKVISKPEAKMDSDVDDRNASIVNECSQVPKMRHVDEISDNGSKVENSRVQGKISIRKIRNPKGIRMKFQMQSTPKFRSIYPTSDEINLIPEIAVDEVTGRGDIERQNKRGDLKTLDETDPEALIFYDHDAIDSPPAALPADKIDKNKGNLNNLEIKNTDKSRSSARSALHHDGVITVVGSALLGKKTPRSMNISDDQLRIEPSGSWKAKMEVLKLNKHADVLKEYLNWRHDIVRPEPIGIFGYTTKISMSTEKDQGHDEIVTTQGFDVPEETTLMSTTVKNSPVPDVPITNQDHEGSITAATSNYDDHVARETLMPNQIYVSHKTTVTFSPASDEISIALQPDEYSITTMISNNDDHVTRLTFVSSCSESSSVSSTTNFPINCSLTGANTTDEVENSTGNLYNNTEENASDVEESSTGRILAPCYPTTKNTVTTCSAELQKSVDHLTTRLDLTEVSNTLSKLVPYHPGQLGDIENDLLLISIMEKNRLDGKNVGKSWQHQKSSSKIYRIRKESDLGLVPHHRRHKAKQKNEYSTSGIFKNNGLIRHGRQLLSTDDFNYKIDNEERDLISDDHEKNVNEDSSVGGILDALYRDHDSGKLGDKWDQLIDKIIHANSSDIWEPENPTDTPTPEQSADDQSALNQLHFKNADKYMREIARKIIHNSNIRISNLDLGTNDDKNLASRKLQHYPRLTRRKTGNKMKKKNVNICANSKNALGNKKSANNEAQTFFHLAKKSVYIRKSRAVYGEAADKSTHYRDHRSLGFKDSQNLEDIAAESDSEDHSESSFVDNYEFEPEETNNSQLQFLRQKNSNCRHLLADFDHNAHYDYSSDIKFLKVIPLYRPSSVLRANNRPELREIETKPSRMTASQLPKMENNHILEGSVKPGKIKSSDFLHGNEAKDDKTLEQDSEAVHHGSRTAKAPPKTCELAEKDQDQEDVKRATDTSSNLGANYEIVPLIHVQIEHQPLNNDAIDHYHVPTEDSYDSCPYPDINEAPGKTKDNDHRDQIEVVTMNMDNDEELSEPSGIGSCPESNLQDGPIISSSPKNDKMNHICPTGEPTGHYQQISVSPTTTLQGQSNRTCERNKIRLKNILAIMEFIKKIEGMIGEEETHVINTAEDQNKEFLFISSDIRTKPVKQTSPKDPKYHDFSSMVRSDVLEHSDEILKEPKSQESPKDIQEHNLELHMNLEEPESNKFKVNTTKNNSTVISDNLPNDRQVLEDQSPQHGNEEAERDILKNLQQKINDRLNGLNDNLAGNKSPNLKTSSKTERSVAFDFSLLPKTKRHRSKRMRLRDPRRKIDLKFLRTEAERPRRRTAGKRVSKRKRKKKKQKKKRRKKKKHKKKMSKNLRDREIKGKPWWNFGRQLLSLPDQQESTANQNLDHGEVPLDHRKRRRTHRIKYPHGKKKKIKKRRKHKNMKKKKKKKGNGKKKMGLRSKRQIRLDGNQVRGGQDCMDRAHPPDVDPAKYLESAHCLRFSDLWYSVYKLENPIIEHTVYLQLFEKHIRADGTTHWEDHTQGSMVRMGTFTRHQRDSKPTIVFTYTGTKAESQNIALNLDPSRKRLLVPSPVHPKKVTDYPEIRGGSGEYLVVPTTAISKDGNECDKAGVGFAAFSKQPDRCDRPKGSCLKNQPLDYWTHDMEARESERPGCYFLSNFASVPSEPIKYNVSGSGSREYLGLEYHSTHVSTIDIQVRSDYNAIVRVGSSGRVTEVYVDSSALEHTVVTVVISNMGLASSPYQPRITDCPSGLPVSWTKAKGIMQVIPPQHDQRVTLDLYGQLLLNEFHCSVEVVNHRGELVAMRRIRVQKMNRCFCVWHCFCACIGGVSGMGCTPMSPEYYHAAGFQGPVPVITTETSMLIITVKNVLALSAFFILLLFLLGILKWLIGMFASTVGRWGLDEILEGSRVEKYFEPELKCRCVMTDDDGSPERTVKICSRKFGFFLNLIFFLAYPIAVCCKCCRKSSSSSKQDHYTLDESKICLITEKEGSQKLIRVSTYGDTKNTRLETEDTRYVMNELKKSQESLQNPKRSKNGNGHKNSKSLLQLIKSAVDVNTNKLVHDLLASSVVFRNLREPIVRLRIKSGTTYSLRGYFLNAEEGGYRFITPYPFKQKYFSFRARLSPSVTSICQQRNCCNSATIADTVFNLQTVFMHRAVWICSISNGTQINKQQEVLEFNAVSVAFRQTRSNNQ